MTTADAGTVRCSDGHHRQVPPVGTSTVTDPDPTAVALDLGGGQTRVWAMGHGSRAAPTAGESLSRATSLVRRGRIVDEAGCVSLLTRLRMVGSSALAAPRWALTTWHRMMHRAYSPASSPASLRTSAVTRAPGG
jgi:hypothetical protein